MTPLLLQTAPTIDWTPALDAANVQVFSGVQQALPFLTGILSLSVTAALVMLLVRMVTGGRS